jgi:membrane-bound metal-dependent hydrolase YbcI (DUF457 family)
MYSTAHLAMGLVLGKITGNYPLAITASLALDLDHLIVHAKARNLFNIKKIWHSAHDSKDGGRTWFHSIFALIIIPAIALFWGKEASFIVFTAMLGHYFLDILDDSDFWPLYPWKKINMKGFIGYFSLGELAFTIALVLTWFLL